MGFESSWQENDDQCLMKEANWKQNERPFASNFSESKSPSP